jgi:hypothetical protein
LTVDKKTYYFLVLTIHKWIGQGLVLVLLLISIPFYAQNTKIDLILKQAPKSAGTYQLDQRNYSAIFLNMTYGSSGINNPAEIRKIKTDQIKRIDLVYTGYPASSYNDLTGKRLQALMNLDPAIFSKKDIEWNLVVQNNCQDESSAKFLYHGFVIYYLDPLKKPSNSADIEYIKEKFKNPDNRDFSKYAFKDSTVLKALVRNGEWNNLLIVADLTGSMSPYITQLLIWYKLNSNQNIVRQWVFFNDGDYKPNEEKVIGNTGGIYELKTSAFENVLDLTYETMVNGNGGDAQENDIEAILKGIALCPECEDVVLIADNQSPVRDIELLDQVTKPVKVILCGSQNEINTQFLKIAAQTGGSIHTIETDISDLLSRKEGEEIKIGKQMFKVEDGKLMLIKEVY